MNPDQTIPLKPYRTMPIVECGEPMVPIPKEFFAFFDPHPYVAAGAPYGPVSPWMLRQSVVDALKRAQGRLQQIEPKWKIMLFDAYRPNAVQQYMVDHEFTLQAQAGGLDPANLAATDRATLAAKVFRIFGIPSDDPATPPLHSTGGAIDCTLADENGNEVFMGSPIDENSDRSNPDYFINATDRADILTHKNRQLLKNIMLTEGFHQLRTEWWHFSHSDQYWAWIERETGQNPNSVALYGRADLL